MKVRRALNSTMIFAILAGGIITPGLWSAEATEAKEAVRFADPAFQRVWTRTDQPVATNAVKRSYYWGPAPFTGAMQEDFVEGKSGKHLVQYFDKGRMEINEPGGDPNSPFYVTPGRLTVEMLKGSIQLGKERYKRLYVPNIPIAGDPDDTIGPTYADFQNFGGYIVRQYPQNLVGQKVVGFVARERGFGENYGYGASGVKYAYFEPVTGWNIPDVFWDYLNSTGPIVQNGKAVSGRLSNPYFYMTGYPIGDAYWSWAMIGGLPYTDVLIQLFERRVLTYVPSAPEGFRVQMGNIGQHYYDWRYKGVGKPAPRNCEKSAEAQGRFGELFKSDVVLQLMLYCPRSVPPTVKIAIQHFEHGHMVFVDRTGIALSYEHPRLIHVLYEDGTSEYFNDYYYGEEYEPTPPPIATPGAGLFAPRLGFGKVWKEKEQVRARLGYATAPEITVNSQNFQVFGAGYMVSDGKDIYIFSDFLSRNWYDWLSVPDPAAR